MTLLALTPCPTATQSNPYPDVKSQTAFEKGLHEKTVKQTSDILLYDGKVCL
jgi:coatomer subunit zeta